MSTGSSFMIHSIVPPISLIKINAFEAQKWTHSAKHKFFAFAGTRRQALHSHNMAFIRFGQAHTCIQTIPLSANGNNKQFKVMKVMRDQFQPRESTVNSKRTVRSLHQFTTVSLSNFSSFFFVVNSGLRWASDAKTHKTSDSRHDFRVTFFSFVVARYERQTKPNFPNEMFVRMRMYDWRHQMRAFLVLFRLFSSILFFRFTLNWGLFAQTRMTEFDSIHCTFNLSTKTNSQQ